MDQKLFRQQALEQHTSRLYGRVLVAPNGSYTGFVFFFAIWLLLAFMWLATATYTQTEMLSGWIERASPTLSDTSEGASVIVTLLVPLQFTPLITEGQVIDLHFTDFPSQKNISYKATVRLIDSKVILANELTGQAIQIGAPVQKVTAVLPSQTVSVYGKKITLRSGMRVASRLEIKTQSLASYIFKDLLSPQGERL
ncbi:MAG: hypothetical protein V4660_17380 [Pseudomonadota bacterium]